MTTARLLLLAGFAAAGFLCAAPAEADMSYYDGRWSGENTIIGTRIFLDVKNGAVTNGMTRHIQGGEMCCITGTVAENGEMKATIPHVGQPNSYTEVYGNLNRKLIFIRAVRNGTPERGMAHFDVTQRR